ncbi:MAG: GDP-mannose 4,6-dehydratase [bacterium]|nr:GDP-mannose 4,6-dehydratase [bacterium]
MNILVTGGAGFIGSHIVEALQADHNVVIIDNINDYYNPEFKKENLALLRPEKFYQVDVTDSTALTEIFKDHKFDLIIHLAARAGVRSSLLEPDLYAKVNLLGTTNLAKLAMEYNVNRFIFGSTSAVYGDTTTVPFSEDVNVNEPISPYAATKRAAELMLYTNHHLHNIQTTILRFFTVYGERGRPDMAPYLFTEKILKEKEIIKFGDGNTSRDYTYIADIVQGVKAAVENPFPYEIINLGNNEPISLNDFIATVEKVTGKTAIIKQVGMQPGDVHQTYANIDKAKKLLNFKPTTSLEEGLNKFASWYQNNRI